jgi:hypothetical protein
LPFCRCLFSCARTISWKNYSFLCRLILALLWKIIWPETTFLVHSSICPMLVPEYLDDQCCSKFWNWWLSPPSLLFLFKIVLVIQVLQFHMIFKISFFKEFTWVSDRDYCIASFNQCNINNISFLILEHEVFSPYVDF